MADQYIPPQVTDSIRFEGVLEKFLSHTTVSLKKVGVIPVAWRTMAGYLKAVIRDDCFKLKLLRQEFKQKDHQLDHLFEVQYFVATFLHTVAQFICTENISFKPDITDISFAVMLINSKANLYPMKIFEHKVKTAFFRAAQIKKLNGEPQYLDANLSALYNYLMEKGIIYCDYLTKQVKISVNDQSHTNPMFKKMFVDNLAASPFCQVSEWQDIFKKLRDFSTPFSTTISSKNYIPQPWIDDNVVYDSIGDHLASQPLAHSEKDFHEAIQPYNPDYVYVSIGIELAPMSPEKLKSMGLVKEDGWLD
ncbi:hypothetical protein JR316_0011152 [Psilocybe cubensis]|uniref:Uncharacterized protein n=2 Tax=Psilocybe cubensis TaxID=181762 RepID=A0A8H8CFS4_PSICU|nr:hypothetical protein JR316_0011152 [Psilocybe cubensis]KAH9477233.1 hypothetical protein JR316_0011152 [Psilocybe cubensis]